MFWQVGSLGPKYKEWVLAPVDRKLRLFGSDFIESLTITSWYMVPSIWIPVMFYLIFVGYQRLRSSLTSTVDQTITSGMKNRLFYKQHPSNFKYLWIVYLLDKLWFYYFLIFIILYVRYQNIDTIILSNTYQYFKTI